MNYYLKEKKGITITKMLDKSNRKPSNIWANKGSKFGRRLLKSWLEKNAVDIYLTDNEGKSVIAERFIRTLKRNKIYRYMTSISKNVYIDKLNDVLNKYNNTYHSAIKIKPVDIKSSI